MAGGTHRWPVFGAVDLRDWGVGYDTLRYRLLQRRWVRPNRGIYADAAWWGSATHPDRLVHSSLAQQRNYHPTTTLSHLSAAAVHGLALPLEPGRATWLTVEGPLPVSRRTDSLVLHRAALPADHAFAAATGGRVTTLARTVADCARHLALPDAVAVADSAARLDSGLPTRLALVLESQWGWPGSRGAAAAYELMDGRRESWLESYSVTTLHAAGLPLPECQVVVLDGRGTFVARVDALWRAWGVVGEADGNGKYLDGGPEATAATVLAEKVREDRLRSLGLEVVRWSTHDILRDLPGVLGRIDAARRRADPSRLSGSYAA